MVEVAGKQAAARVGDAQRAMHEDLEFDVRAFLANLGDFVERQLARQDDPAIPSLRQKRTAAKLTVLACTERCTGISGQVSRTRSISPGSAMISASGLSATTGAMSAR
jgi:hypothetical protein